MLPYHCLLELFNLSQHPSLVILPEGQRLTIAAMNNAFRQYIGLDENDYTGKEVTEIVVCSTANNFIPSLATAIQQLRTGGAEPFSVQQPLQHNRAPLTIYGPLQITARPLCSSQGNNAFVLITLEKNLTSNGKDKNIPTAGNVIVNGKGYSETEQGSLVAALKDSEAQYKLLFHFNPLPIWIYDANTCRVLDANQSATNHYGYTREEFLQLRTHQLEGTLALPGKTTEPIPGPGGILDFGISTHYKKDGSRLQVQVSGYRLHFQQRDCIIVVNNDITDREYALQQLKDHEAKLITAQKIARLGYWHFRITDKQLYWTEEVYNIWGLTRELFEVTYDAYLQTIHPEDRESLGIQRAAALRGEKVLDTEHRIVLPDGAIKWVLEKGALVKNSAGDPVVFEGTVQDITQRKLAELQVLEVYEEKNLILESIGDAFFAIDRNWIVNYWNKVAERILLTPRDNIVGKNLWEVFSDAVDTRSYTEYHLAMEEHTVRHFETYYDRLKRWFEVSVYPSANGLSVYFKDISEQKKSTEQVRYSNERFEKVTEATNDAIWDWDIVNNRLFQGDGFRKLFGIEQPKDVPVANEWKHYIHPDDAEQVYEGIRQAIQQPDQGHWQAAYRFLKSDNTYAYITNRAAILRNEEGMAIRMVGAITDITAQKVYEESLKKLNQDLEKSNHELLISNKELEQFAYVASHDLQEPLRMVAGFLSQLDKKYHDQLDEKAHQYIHFAVDGAKRMRQIILDLLEFSKIGRWNEKSEMVDVALLVKEVLPLYQNKLEECGAMVTIGCLPVINSYPTPLKQVFQNLVSNALKYHSPGTQPAIEIKGEELPDCWKFSVEDNGIGIDAEYFDRIFLIFQRLHQKGEYNGTGMGLAICKKIVDNMGGRIWVDSTEGKGSTFYFTIPKA